MKSRAGSAFVNIRVGLGQAHTNHHGQHAGGRRGGGPAKQRRLERRAAARKATSAAENTNHEQSEVGEGALAKNKTEEAEDASEKVTNSPIPQFRPMKPVHMKTF